MYISDAAFGAVHRNSELRLTIAYPLWKCFLEKMYFPFRLHENKFSKIMKYDVSKWQSRYTIMLTKKRIYVAS